MMEKTKQITSDFTIHGDVIECKISCTDSKMEELGIDQVEWLGFAFDLNEVVAVKETYYDSDPDTRSAVFYIPMDHFVSNIDYREGLRMWLTYKKFKKVK